MKQGKGRLFRFGIFTIVITAVVVGILVLVNVIFDQLPESAKQIDLSAEQLSDISDQTIQVLNALNEDVTIHLIAQDGKEEAVTETLLRRYADLSEYVHFDVLDPDTAPNIKTKYNITGTLSNNSVVVETEERFRYIPYSATAPSIGLYVTYQSKNMVDPESDEYEYQYTNYEAERAVTGAIDYVTRDTLPVIYFLAGHGEYEVDSAFTQELARENIESASLNLSVTGEVPSDCRLILVFAPENDLSENDAKLISEYLEKGGKLMFFNRAEAGEMPNLLSVLSSYGLSDERRLVVETNTDYYYGSADPLYLLPIMESHEITDSLINKNYRVMMIDARPILVSENLPEGLQVTTLIRSSKSAYAKMLTAETIDKEEDDPTGPFVIGALSEKEGAGTVLWFSSLHLLNYNADAVVAGANANLFTNAVNYLVEEADRIGITPKTVARHYLIISGATGTVLTVIFSVVIPLLILTAGIVIVIRRRRK